MPVLDVNLAFGGTIAQSEVREHFIFEKELV